MTFGLWNFRPSRSTVEVGEAEEVRMHASVGDRLIVHGAHVDDVDRDGEILEVRGENGAPPYVVRWSDNGHEAFIFPGPDAEVHHFEQRDSTQS